MGVVEKQLEQRKIGTGKNHLFAVIVKQPMTDHVEPPLIEQNHIATRTILTKLGAPQQRLDTRLQLTRAERFAQIIVGPQLQADDPVGLVRTGGQHDDRHVRLARMLAHPFAQAKTVFIRQHHVKDQQITGFFVEGAAKFRAIAHRAHLKTGATQVGVQQLANLLIVIHQQDRFTD
ncbi:hypothetical protein ALP75_205203 [Pseudomonas syringae pv. actinidiae]|nr:hypothetical protein ALP75_205203 [Pseudomonas syringae pv. actinidiae]